MTDAIEVPYQQLSEQALQGLIEEYVSREGTDYGEIEFGFEEKLAQVRLFLEKGKAVIVFDPILESCTLIAKE